jgi:hypothetical protein
MDVLYDKKVTRRRFLARINTTDYPSQIRRYFEPISGEDSTRGIYHDL